MLVIFSSTASGDITMFADVARHLLKLMGQSGHIPGGIFAEDVPAVLDRLQQAVSAEQQKEEVTDPSNGNQAENGDPPAVTVSARAYPLLEMLKAAAADETGIMWRQK